MKTNIFNKIKTALASICAPKYVYLVTSTWMPDIGTPEFNLIASFSKQGKAHDALVREVHDYIESWHEGDEVEHRTKESYFKDGFTKDGTVYCLCDEPSKIERWVLEESDTFMEFAITRMIINKEYDQ